MTSDPTATTAFPQLGRYQVLRKLGEGGMGAVYLALDTQLDRQVAIKVLPEQSVNNSDSVGRFQREARALAKLSHPGIIQAYDNGSHGDHHFLVMEFVDGKSLADLLAEKGTLSPTRVADFGHQAALALQHAHAKGLIHRDLKPSNLLVTSEGQVKILDLGLARFLQDNVGDPSKTREGVGMGTPDYAAPEQFRDAHAVDVRADIYALGCTLYHLLTGQVPFPGTSLAEKYDAHAVKDPPLLEEVCPDVPLGLAVVVRKMMAKKPADRHQTAQEVANALTPFVTGSSLSFGHLKATQTWHQGQLKTTALQLPPRRRFGMWALAGCVALVLLVVGVWMGAKFFGSAPVVAVSGAKPDDKGQPGDDSKNDSWIDPNVLTVSKEEEGGGRYRTITAALKDVSAGQKVLVLDDATYVERLSLKNPTDQSGITLEAARGATIEVPVEGGFAIDLKDVSGVTIRGFSLRGSGGRTALILAERLGPGTLLENLDLELPRRALRADDVLVGISVEHHRVVEGAPMVVRRCRFHGGQTGVQLADFTMDSSGIVIRENDFNEVARGVLAMGSWGRAAVVGNTFRGCVCGVQLEMLGANARDLLLANNTFIDGTYAIRLADGEVHGRIACRNNLILNRGLPDVTYYHWDGRPGAPPLSGDGLAVVKSWQMTHNWREVGEPHGESLDEKSWVPVGEKDVRRDKIAINRDSKSSDFLRPDPASPLATAGAGKEEPSLPSYVGAVPPEGVEPWDWDRTWLAPPGTTKLLTVSKEEKDGGTYRSINAALDKANKWDTIRVLDNATYEEVIALTEKDKHEGLCLEAVHGAKLQMPMNRQRLLFLRNVPNVEVTGFDLSGKGLAGNGNIALLVSIAGDASGVKLSHLNLSPGFFAQATLIQNVVAEPRAKPLRLRNCSVTAADPKSDGVVIDGTPGGNGTSGVQVADCRMSGLVRGVVVSGMVRDIQVVGNRIGVCAQGGLNTINLHAESTNVLFAANSVFGCGVGYRHWESKPYPEHRAGQVELSNNLFVDAVSLDLCFHLAPVDGQAINLNGDADQLQRLWLFRRNYRDFSGGDTPGKMPMAKEDRLLNTADLESTAFDAPDRWRPKKASALARDGAGVVDPSLPVYIGALPPDGVAPWDWDRTWRARASKVTKPAEVKAKDKSDE